VVEMEGEAVGEEVEEFEEVMEMLILPRTD